MPDVLKCPECDANADVTKDGTQIGNNTNAVLYTKQISQANTHTVLHVSTHLINSLSKNSGKRIQEKRKS
jgi:hypothetical protein